MKPRRLDLLKRKRQMIPPRKRRKRGAATEAVIAMAAPQAENPRRKRRGETRHKPPRRRTIALSRHWKSITAPIRVLIPRTSAPHESVFFFVFFPVREYTASVQYLVPLWCRLNSACCPARVPVQSFFDTCLSVVHSCGTVVVPVQCRSSSASCLL